MIRSWFASRVVLSPAISYLQLVSIVLATVCRRIAARLCPACTPGWDLSWLHPCIGKLSSPIACTAAAGAMLAGLIAAPPALAQQTVFSGEVTVTATGTEEPADDVPVAVTVITRAEIDDAQEDSVADMLRRAPGLTVISSGGEGSAVSLFTRGTESDHTLAMFDGVRLTSPYFGGYDWSLLPTAGLERIEVARGPFSALWGADAIGGAINVVPAVASNGLEPVLLAEVGEDGWSRMEGSLAWSEGGLDLHASGLDRESRGELANSDVTASQLLVDAGWSWAPGSRVAVLIQSLATEIGIPFADPLTPTPHRRQTADQRLLAMPLRARVTDHWSLELVASRVERELEFRDPDDPFGYTSGDTAADTTQARLASRHELGAHALTWGAEWREDEVSDSSSFGTNLDGQTTNVSSVFLQDEWQPTKGVRVISGVRWDDADEWGSEVSPRVAVGWHASKTIELRAGYGQAFRQPSIGELYFPFSGNPALEAETSESLEAGVSWSAGGTRLDINLFSTKIKSLIDFDYVTYSFANTTGAEVRGVELGLDMPLSRRISSSVQATWLDTEDASGERLLRRPEWSGAVTLRGALGRHLRGDLTLLWVGARPDVDAVSFTRIRLDSHLSGTVAVAYEMVRGLELTVRVVNLADETYEEIAGYPAPGRRVIGGLRWRP